MIKKILFSAFLFVNLLFKAQTNPAITKWLFNTTGITGKHYIISNTTPITDATLANVQQVSYSSTYAYVSATGIPSHIAGPYAIGAVSVALNNNYTFKIPLNPLANTGTPTNVGGGAIAVFIDGTVAFAARDNATYNNAGQWHQNAVYFENSGFDCAHAHPGPMTADYHVHQNPMAFNLSLLPTSTVCSVYQADGLYIPDSTTHGPLLGFASDGFPIYGAYGYSDPLNVTSSIKRIASSYRLRNITSRTTLPNNTVAAGPTFTQMITSMLPNSSPLPAVLGAYCEDYEFVTGLGDLDVHNGRFCKTPDYPNGIYCYFATIDGNNNPVYPYIIGDTYYGVSTITNGPGGGAAFTSATIPTGVTIYTPPAVSVKEIDRSNLEVKVYTIPDKELLVIQSSIYQPYDRTVKLINMSGEVVQTNTLYQGSIMCYFDLQTVYAGLYFIEISAGSKSVIKKVLVQKN